MGWQVLFGLVGRGKGKERALSRPGTPSERRALVLRYGYNGMSFLTLYQGWEYFHPTEGEGFVAFERHNGAALACGDPVCPEGQEAALIDAFRAWAASEKLTPAFVGATERLAAAAHSAGWKTLKVGEEPLFDLAGYAPRGNKTKKVRSAANQARKGGVTVELLPAGSAPPATLALEMRDVQTAWQATRNITALSFTLRLAPLEHVKDKIVLIARKNGRLEGFVTCIPVPARNACYIEDMIRRPDAPNGVSELLFLNAVAACRERGAAIANLGLAPLRNTKQQPHGHRFAGRALEFTFRRLNLFYKFKPLEHFKAKFGPDRWENAYLVYRPGRLARVALGLTCAFTPGAFGPVAAAASRFRRQGAGAPVKRPRLSPGHVAGMAGSAAFAVAYSAVAWQNPELFEPIRLATHVLTTPVLHVEHAARAHIIVDSLLLLAAGGLYARSARRD